MAGSPDLGALLDGPVEEVARRLLGAYVVHGEVAVRLSEVEAYGGTDDRGSHAFRGPTTRNASMFGPAGTLYCYLSYGTHVCANVVTGPPGVGAAVLLRGGEVVTGLPRARERRRGVADRDLARGPGNLARALGLGLDLDGVGLLDDGDADAAGDAPRIRLPAGPVTAISTGPRVGLTHEGHRPWRFWATGDPTVSTYRRSPRLVSPSSPC